MNRESDIPDACPNCGAPISADNGREECDGCGEQGREECQDGDSGLCRHCFDEEGEDDRP